MRRNESKQEELRRNIHELRSELNQTLNFSVQQMQIDNIKTCLQVMRMQQEGLETMGKQQDALKKVPKNSWMIYIMMVEENCKDIEWTESDSHLKLFILNWKCTKC